MRIVVQDMKVRHPKPLQVPGCDIPYKAPYVSDVDEHGNEVQVPDDGGTELTAWGPDTQGREVCHSLVYAMDPVIPNRELAREL